MKPKFLLLFFLLTISLLSKAQTDLLNGDGNFTNTANCGVWCRTGDFWFDCVGGSTCYTSSCSYAWFAASSGVWSSHNSASGQLYHNVTNPANAISGYVQANISINTLEASGASAFDYLYIKLYSSSGSYLATLGTYSNQQGANQASPCQTYWTTPQLSIPSQYLNSTNYPSLRLQLEATTDASNPTIFRVDDIVYMVTTQSCTAVTIATNPSSQTQNVGGTANFSVSVNGTPPFSYFWYGPSGFITNTTNSSSSSNSLNVSSLTTNDAGNYYCLVTNCTNTYQAQSSNAYLTVNSPCIGPTANFTPSQTSITAGGNITTTNNSSGNPSPSYSWSVSPSSGVSFSPNNTASNPTITFANSGTYSVSLTASNSCSPFTNTTNATITVTTGCTAPTASFNPSQTSITAGGNITTTNNSSGNPTPTYSWSVSPSSGVTFNPSNTASNPTITFANTGTYTVSLTASNSCSPFTNTANSTITVSAGCTAPIASFTPSQTSITAGGNITTTNNSSGNPTPTYSWSVSPSSGVTFNPNNTASNPTITFANSGAYSVSLTASNSCNPFTNTANYTITVNSGTIPAITVINPNGGQSYFVGTPFTITASYTPTNLTSIFNFDLSINNGQTWSFLGSSWGTNGNVSLPINPNTPSSQCLVRVRTSTGGNAYQDVSNNTFSIVAPNNGIGFSLNQNVSHLYWPFPNSNWDINPNATVRHGWKGGQENGGGCGHGCGGHHVGDYFADDWNKTTGAGDCDSLFLSPLYGVVICAYSGCNVHACSAPACGFDANKVTVRSLDNPEFAFKVLHLNSVFVHDGDTVHVGDQLGRIGSTGHSFGSHAHCVLYKHLSYLYSNTGQTGLQRLDACSGLGYDTLPIYDPNVFAADFLFDAVPGGTGGSETDLPLSLSGAAQLCPNDSLTITAPNGYSYYWSTGDTSQAITVNQAGNYTVIANDNLGNVIATQSIIVTVAQQQSIGISDATTLLCSGGSAEIFSSLSNPSDTTGDYSPDDHHIYHWSTGSNSMSTLITNGGTYYLTVSDVQGCFSNVDSITIVEIPNPTQPIISQTGQLVFSSTVQGCTYQWYLNNTAVATGQVISTDTIGSGVYTVAAINSNGCRTLSNPFVVSGVEDLSSIDVLRIYPNPNSGIFTLSLKSETEKRIELACLNLFGEKVYERQFELYNGELKTELNLSSVAKGLYLVRITANGKSIYRKVTVTE